MKLYCLFQQGFIAKNKLSKLTQCHIHVKVSDGLRQESCDQWPYHQPGIDSHGVHGKSFSASTLWAEDIWLL